MLHFFRRFISLLLDITWSNLIDFSICVILIFFDLINLSIRYIFNQINIWWLMNFGEINFRKLWLILLWIIGLLFHKLILRWRLRALWRLLWRSWGLFWTLCALKLRLRFGNFWLNFRLFKLFLNIIHEPFCEWVPNKIPIFV